MFRTWKWEATDCILLLDTAYVVAASSPLAISGVGVNNALCWRPFDTVVRALSKPQNNIAATPGTSAGISHLQVRSQLRAGSCV